MTTNWMQGFISIILFLESNNWIRLRTLFVDHDFEMHDCFDLSWHWWICSFERLRWCPKAFLCIGCGVSTKSCCRWSEICWNQETLRMPMQKTHHQSWIRTKFRPSRIEGICKYTVVCYGKYMTIYSAFFNFIFLKAWINDDLVRNFVGSPSSTFFQKFEPVGPQLSTQQILTMAPWNDPAKAWCQCMSAPRVSQIIKVAWRLQRVSASRTWDDCFIFLGQELPHDAVILIYFNMLV